MKTSRVKTNVLQVNLLQSEVVGSQPGIVNLQNDPGIVNGSSKDLAIKKQRRVPVNNSEISDPQPMSKPEICDTLHNMD